jgi:CRP/FNR family transcriptional regulator
VPDSQKINSTLRGNILFSKLESGSLSRLTEIGKIVGFERGETLFREGDLCPGIFVVAEGSLRVFKTSAGGKEHLLHLAGPGDVVAEVAVIGDFNCPASAEASEPSVCVLLPRVPFLAAVDGDPRLSRAIMQGLALRVRYMVGLLEDVVLRDAAGRLARHLLAYDEEAFHLSMLKKDLASHLNLTGETLSRTLRRFVESGLIEMSGDQQIRILDPDELALVAQGLTPLL